MRRASLLPALLLVIGTLCLSPAAHAETEQPLWPGPPSGALGTAPQDIPTLTVFAAPTTGTLSPVVLVCPGGAYQGLTMDFEGANVARWLQSRGVTGVVLRYRLPKNGYRHPVPLQDIQRAVRTLRARAQELHVDPKRVGIMGFSAGGHLVTTLSTHNDDGNPAATDPVEKLGSRPDFCIAVYPVISLDEAITHKVSRLNLLGPNPDPTLVEDLCNEKRVNPRTPPTMLIHSADDKGVPVDNSLRYFAALRAASIPAELHVFDTGGHGFGLGRPVDKAPKDWLVPLESWMRRHGWMP